MKAHLIVSLLSDRAINGIYKDMAIVRNPL